jgi:hypothetical protein
MFRRSFFVSAVALTLIGALASAGALHAQPGKSRPHPKTPPPTSQPRGHDPHKDHHHKGDPWTWKCDRCGRHHGRDERHCRDCDRHDRDHDRHHDKDKHHHKDRDRWGFAAGFGGFEFSSFGGFANPYTPGMVSSLPGGTPYGLGTPYSAPGYEGYGGGYGGTPMDYGIPTTADIMRAYGQVIKSDEEARLLREQTELLRLTAAKKRAETKAYIDSITPTASQREAKLAGGMVAHAIVTSNPNEIGSGEALNILLADLRKSIGKGISSNPIGFSEGILGRINVSVKRNGSNPGLLRNEGKLAWPCGLEGIVSREQRGNVDREVQAAVRELSTATVSRRSVPELQKFLAGAMDSLAKKIHDMPTSRYLEAKSFLSGLEAAASALENGDAVPYLRFQKWIGGGRTLPEVVDYMLREGLQFAAAFPGDEGAYRALHNGLAAYHVTINPQPAAPVVASAGSSQP